MKRILINATQNEEIRVALCKGNHLYDFDLENRTREQKKSNIYKGHVTRVEPSLEAVFVEYGSQRQGFLPIREISSEYLSGNPRDENIKKLIKEGDELIVQVEKEERGNKGAALSTYVSLAGRYLVLMPNNPRGGGISRQISGKLREDMKRMLGSLDLAKGMSVIIRTAGIGKTQEDLQHDLNHLLNIWQAIQEQNQKYPSPRLVHQEAGVVTRAVRDYLRDDISEIWIDNENAYIEAAGFIDAVMPTQADKLRKYTDYEPMFSRFNIEKQIETAYQREVRLPSGGSIVIDQTEALVSIDINSAKSTKGSDVAETAYHTNLEAADEIARQLRLRDMGGLIVIDFIDMNDNKHQKEVEKRLIDATKYDRARVQFGDISKFGLMEMSRQRLRPSLEESTGYICPRCHGNGMIRDLRSLSLSIMRQIEQIALKERQGEVQAEVPTDIAAFLLNEKRDSLVYLEQDSGTRITILPHAHLESPNFKLHFNRDGFAPSSYERITDTAQENSDLGYEVDWQTAEKERPEQQPTRQPLKSADSQSNRSNAQTSSNQSSANQNSASQNTQQQSNNEQRSTNHNQNKDHSATAQTQSSQSAVTANQPQAVAWLSNLFAQAPQAQTARSVSSGDAAQAIEALVNSGAQSLGSFGQVDNNVLSNAELVSDNKQDENRVADNLDTTTDDKNKNDDRRHRKPRKPRPSKPHQRKEQRDDNEDAKSVDSPLTADDKHADSQQKSAQDSHNRNNTRSDDTRNDDNATDEQPRAKRKPNSQRSSRGKLERGETLTADVIDTKQDQTSADNKAQANNRRNQDPNEVVLKVNEAPTKLKTPEVVHLSLDDSKSAQSTRKPAEQQAHSATDAQPKAIATTATVKEDSAPSPDVGNANTLSSDDKTAVEQNIDATTLNATSLDVTDTNVAEPKTDVSASSKVDIEQTEPSVSTTNNQLLAASDNDASESTASSKESMATENMATDSEEASVAHDVLFANRYVTADKFGQASNDPRVVRRKQAQSTEPQAVQKSVKVSAVRGTVGEFIYATLPEAKTRLADEGIINCFIAAIAIHKDNAQNNADSQNDNVTTSEVASSHFDFSNYGYQSLTADYLARFNAMTQAVSQFAIPQGKTEVELRAIDQRASNDPRGQHPDYKPQLSSVSITPTQLQTEAAETELSSTLEAQDIEAHDVEASALAGEVVSNDISAKSEQTLQTDHDSESNIMKPIAAEDANTSQDDIEQVDAEPDNVAQDDVEKANVEQESIEKNTAEQTSSLVTEESEGEQSTKEDSPASKSKTTIASYKNMIENVAEQLSPQTGMFNLTSPKVPKARTRKVKPEPKKQAQDEKLESDNLDSES